MNESLPPAAQPAWNAYQAMAVTKEQHFRYLKHLEEKYENFGRPTPDEQAELDRLLARHDGQVRAFRDALQSLRQGDPEAHAALVSHLAREGEGPGH